MATNKRGDDEKTLYFSDVMGKTCYSDLDYRDFVKMIRQYRKTDKPEGMTVIRMKFSATFLAELFESYLTCKKHKIRK